MNKTLSIFVVVGTMATVQANATLLTFDDISAGETLVPGGYGGLTWNNFYVLDGKSDLGGFKNGVVSGNNVAYNGDGDIASANGAKFDLNSAYLTSAWFDDNSLTVVGYLKGVEQYRETYVLNTAAPTFINFNFLGIDSVTFSSSEYQFVMDDLTISRTHVPETATWINGVLAMLPFGLLRTRRLFSRTK
jgi:hypothetical protein